MSKDADHWERQKEMLEFAAKLAEDHNAAWVLELNGRGIGSVGMKNDFYIDTGIDGSITIHGNAGMHGALPPALPQGDSE